MIETERLILRQWRDSDLPSYRDLNADHNVMRYFPSLLNSEQSDAQAEIIRQLIEQRGWGFWAVEVKQTQEFIGFVGLHQQAADSGIPNSPLVEIGWRLAEKFWGNGYAPEAARAALDYAFNQLELEQVYSFTALQNHPSQQVMKKLGMVNIDEDFDHPKLPSGHRLQRHCLYRITRDQWIQG
ncbi:GNAT family N-acetyltransferase [Vibrio brasiliensis]|uniref:GNAT family N-acetyltransferase n=1 Tax=Vibrio brasiliensis TaxID=170652 RepID=UPI001EFD9456|nr:GNAT family N-acetyltransferase [Vibrio brasiliensis]MCG9647312.1 GNAT family N-acetyltransferase [Vibrio brasiliensis]